MYSVSQPSVAFPNNWLLGISPTGRPDLPRGQDPNTAMSPEAGKSLGVNCIKWLDGFMVEGIGEKLCGAKNFTTENNGDKENKGKIFLERKKRGETSWDETAGSDFVGQNDTGQTSWGTKRIRAEDF